MISPGNLIMSIKAVLISTGVLAVAMLLKISVPLAMDFSVYAAPIIWSSLLLWLKPPYLYVVINGIIITIAASSRFHRSNRDEEEMFAVETTTDMKTQTEQIFHSEKVVEVFADPVVDYGYEMVKDLPTSIDLVESTVEIAREAGDEEKSAVVVVENADSVEDEANETTFSWNLPERTDSSEIATSGYLPAEEKPLVSARFGHRKIPKTTPEGGSRRLKVSKKTKRQETLENTWKMITEGRSMPLTRHMKKSDTWENHGRHIDVDASIFKKSETFRDMTNYQTPSETATESPAKLRKEPSLSQDELNRRVEAFIKKFNEDMRLQREESLRQYKEMIK